MSPFLSKSDFKIAQSCITKLFYKKNGYPSADEQNEYLLMLADGGYMVGKMAQLLFEPAIEITTEKGTPEAILKTEEYLQQSDIILFEPAISINNKLIRIDILKKIGNTYQIIEVKSKSFDSIDYSATKLQGKKYFELAEWREYIEDIAFQKFVLKEKFPSAKIETFLFLPDKSKTTPIDGLLEWFQIEETTIVGETKFRKTDVSFVGDLEELKKGHVLELVNVDEYVDKILPVVEANSNIYIESIVSNKKIERIIDTSCNKCEFTITNNKFTESGFKQCWKELADAKPHLFELAQLGNFNRSKEKHIDNLIKNKKTSLAEIPLEIIQNKYNNRPFYQVTKNDEFLLPAFLDEIKQIEYPLFFIDFETSQMAIPYHAGMRPYSKIIFQWSCHVIEKPGDNPKHFEWLNTINKYPNFEFATTLKELLKDKGSILIWTQYENTILKDIYNSLDSMSKINPELKDWLEKTIKFSKEDSTRFIDMNNLALKYYFHPHMGGRTSIKVTLPAVLKASNSEKVRQYLTDVNLLKLDSNGKICDPYKQLPKISVGDTILDVSNGTDAMIAYQEMLYGISRNNPDIKKGYEELLRQYCKLDTLAMVIIWEHWSQLSRK